MTVEQGTCGKSEADNCIMGYSQVSFMSVGGSSDLLEDRKILSLHVASLGSRHLLKASEEIT